jgi:hypothetical protein
MKDDDRIIQLLNDATQAFTWYLYNAMKSQDSFKDGRLILTPDEIGGFFMSAHIFAVENQGGKVKVTTREELDNRAQRARAANMN